MDKCSISLVIIAKDEANSIEKAILSAKGIVDEIIVIDTGSTDNTIQIAEQNGALVFKFVWSENFSAARNYAILKVSKDWILTIDADERIVYFDKDLYDVENQIIGGYLVNIKNYLNNNNDYTTHKYTRFFRNNKNFNYSGRIHEQIRDSIEEQGFEIADSTILIEHFGYINTSEEKLLRNIKLLDLDLLANPTDYFAQYHKAQTLFGLQRFDDAKNIFLKIMNHPNISTDQNEFSKLRLSQIYLANNEFEKAIEFCQFSSENIEKEGLRFYILAACYMNLFQFEKAFECYSKPEVKISSAVDKNIVIKAIEFLNKFLDNK